MCDEEDGLSPYRSTLIVKPKNTRRQFSTAKTGLGAVSGQLTEHKMLKEEAEQKSTDVEHDVAPKFSIGHNYRE